MEVVAVDKGDAELFCDGESDGRLAAWRYEGE